ncbi:MAG: histidine phosphatase family protein, partial [Bacillota bacterium]
MKIDAEPGTRILLIRHGRTSWNEHGRLMGRADIPLDEVGRAQARALLRLVRPFAPKAIWSSPLRRARATALPLATEFDLTPHVDDRWSEVDVGELEGLTWSEIEERYPDFAGDLRMDPNHTRRPAGPADGFPHLIGHVL